MGSVAAPRLDRGRVVEQELMSWVYILENLKTRRYYVGSTIDLDRRLKQHKAGNTKTTRRLNAKKLVYWESYKTEREPREREKQIKSYKSKKYIEDLVRHGSVAQW